MPTNQNNNRKVAVVAIGGNSLIKDKDHQAVPDQYQAAGETAYQIARMIQSGWDVAIGHGNGPQVGFILRRSELSCHELHEVPLDACGADTQGAIGYALQQNLYNHFLDMGIDKPVVTVVTQVEVNRNDPAFQNPSKPIGSFMGEAEALQRQAAEGWDVVEDAEKAVETVKARKAQRFLAYIQRPSVSFFKRNRWKAVGDVTPYQGVPHQLMEAEL